MKKTPNFRKICQNLLKDLPQRQKEVILRRFGLETGKRETLESIGEDHRITRERVRQIEADGLSKVKPRIKDYQKVFQYLVNYLKNWGDLKREDLLLFQLGEERFQNQIYFLLSLADQFSRFRENENFYSLWTINQNSLNLAQKINNFLISQMKERKNPLSFPEVFKIYKKSPLSGKEKTLNSQSLLSFIEISKDIEQGLDNLFGLKTWPEISPRGIKDKTYLALKRAGEPLHFIEITSHISKLDFPFQLKEERKALSQTVHNELIKDPRFVLVGRGIYALKEWGFVPGFVKDIIEKVLREKKRPMTKEEIIKEVQKQRLVKFSTILLNLQNKKYFLKDSQGKYIVKEI